MCKNRTEYQKNGGRDIEIALEVAMIIRRRRSGQCGRFQKYRTKKLRGGHDLNLTLTRVFKIEAALQKTCSGM